MNTLRRIPGVPMALLALMAVALGLALGFKLSVKAQDTAQTASSGAWMQLDIGTGGAPIAPTPDGAGGFSVATSAAAKVRGSDSVQWVYQPLTGDGQILARVSAIQGDDPMAQAGVMLRETLDADSRNAAVLVGKNWGTSFQWRQKMGGGTFNGGANRNPKGFLWVKLVRLGNWLGGYASADGTTWSLVQWLVLTNLAPQAYVGVVVGNGGPGTALSTASFDQISAGPPDLSALPPEAGAAKAAPDWQYSMRPVLPPSALATGDGQSWWRADIGANAFSDAAWGAGTFTVTSSGLGIASGHDSFHYVYQPLTGDGQVVARVLGIRGTNDLAQAGVMVRESLDDHARGAALLTTRGAGLSFQYRFQSGGFMMRSVSLTNQPASCWVKAVRLGNWLGGYTSSDGLTWTLVDWTVISDLSSQVYVGLAVADHGPFTSASTAEFDQVSCGSVDLGSLPAEPGAAKNSPDWQKAVQWVKSPLPLATQDTNAWWHADVGAFAYSDASWNAGTFSVSSTGRGIDGGGDSFHFIYQPLAGDGQLVARVLGLQGNNPLARAGVMVRETLEDNARAAALLGSRNAGPAFQYRSISGGLTVQTPAWTNPVAPYWVKAVRLGNWLGGYTSSDGITWTLADWTVLNDLAPQVFIGLAVANHGPTRSVSTAWFDQVTTGPVDLPSLPPEPGAAKAPPDWQRSMQWVNPPAVLAAGDTNGWWHADIGRGAYSDASLNAGTFTLASSGLQLGTFVDSFHFIYQPLTGDVQIVARLLDLRGGIVPGGKQSAQAGVTLRETLDPNSRNAAALLVQGAGTSFQGRWRVKPGGPTSRFFTNTAAAAPVWLKLARVGDCLSSYVSPDGNAWSLLNWSVVPRLTPQVFVGLAVAGHGPAASVASASFDQVSVGPVDMTTVISPQVGTGDGLLGSYYPDSCLYGPPADRRVDPQVDFTWLHGEPMGLLNGAPFGVCWSGEVQAQFTEPYTFSLESCSADWVRVWLNDQLLLDQWKLWHDNGDFTAPPVNLVAGKKYLLRVEFFNNRGQAVAKLNWSSPSTPKCLVPQSQLYSQPTDTDGNGLPDDWQMLYFGHLGVDPNADPDADGLSNLEEYQHHTNPLKADTDADGMPDGWEVAHRLNPTYNDAAESVFQDGLSNLQKYLAGIDPNQSDTGGTNGLPFGLVLRYLGVNPTNAASLAKVAASATGSQASIISGNWQTDGPDLYALSRGGELQFALTVAAADKYVLKVVGTQDQPTAETTLSLLVSVDGESFGHRMLPATFGTDGVLDLVTPYLPAGTHTVRVRWDGAVRDSRLRLRRVVLLAVAGPDTDGNGIKDWVDKMVADESGFDLTNAIIPSYVSPVCLEGRDPYLSMMRLVSALPQSGATPLAVNRGPNNRWYANVPLSPAVGSLAQLSASFQNGARLRQRWLQWLPLNILSATNLSVRTGDSLLLLANPPGATTGTVAISVGTNQLPAAVGTPVAFRFAQSGSFTVTGSYTSSLGASQTGTFTVSVVDYQFPNNPDCAVDQEREWDLTNVPPAVVVQTDSRMLCQQIGAFPPAGRQMNLLIDQPDPRLILARLGANGPVLASATANGFHLLSDNETYDQVLTTYPDGSRLVETLIDLGSLPPGAVVQVHIFVAGVTFDDGTVTKILTAADFNALGQCVLRFIWPAGATTSICHTITVLQGATIIR